jgi:glycosyltransferase involved in cell wall biosynthesis
VRALLVVFHWTKIGGLELVTVELGRALQAAGVDLEVWSIYESGIISEGGIVAKGFAPHNYFLKWFHDIYFWKGFLANRMKQKLNSFDLVIAGHARLLTPIRRVLETVRGESPQCWAWAHGTEVWGYLGATLAQDLNWADKVVAVSEFTASQVTEWVEPDRLYAVPNMVDTSLFTPGNDGSEVKRDEILIVGRLAARARYKGHDMLMQALQILERKHSLKACLSIVGDGDGRPRLEAIAGQCKLDHRVEFRGRIGTKELIEAYRRCAVFAMPSRVDPHPRKVWTGEGFGVVYLEAAACGRPVIASTEGGAPEAIIPGKTGFLVDPRSPEAIADSLAILLADPAEADKMGRAGRVWVEKNFSIEVFRERVRELLNR